MNVLSQKITHFTVFFLLEASLSGKLPKIALFWEKKVKFGIILRRNCQNFMEE